MRRVEILAPAASFGSMRAAVNAGCDAVYMGGGKFGARAFAKNLGEEKLLEAIDYMHLHGKKIYMTVNTLLKEREIEEELYAYLKPYYEQGVDAVIVQDLGVLHFVHERFPDLKLHASTQMSLTGAYGAGLLEPYGVTRFVPARELGLPEIRSMRKQTSLEIECFVHGALCYCYSGQCLLSSMIGGRSGNRGRCAQPCRMEYKIPEAEGSGYLLSPADIRTLHLIPELVEAGIDSFKIEGRMKRPEYTALCTHLYRKYTDLYFESGREGFARFQKDHKKEFEADNLFLEDIYNRGSFSDGYLNQYHGRKMMSMDRPNHYGVRVGTTECVRGNQATIRLLQDVSAQDILEFRDGKGKTVYDFTLGSPAQKGGRIKANFMRGLPIHPGYEVYRTRNQSLLDQLAQDYLNHDRKILVEGYFVCKTGQPLKMEFTCGRHRTVVYGDIVSKAERQPMTKEKLLQAIGKISDTLYVFQELDGTVSEDAFAAVGAVKSLRRRALAALESELLMPFKRDAGALANVLKETGVSLLGQMVQNRHRGKIALDCSVQTMEQVEAARKTEAIRRIYLAIERMSEECAIWAVEEIRAAGKEVYLSLPYIVRSNTFDTILEYSKWKVDGYLVHNLEEAAILKRMGNHKPIIPDSNLYTWNAHAKAFWREEGSDATTLPFELNESELRERGAIQDTILVYGRLPLMVSAQCLIDNCKSCSHRPGIHRLVDRKQKEYYVVNSCRNCYNLIYDGEALSLLEEREAIQSLGVSAVRMDFTVEGEAEMKLLLKNFTAVFCHNSKVEKPLEHTHKGHFRRGVE